MRYWAAFWQETDYNNFIRKVGNSEGVSIVNLNCVELEVEEASALTLRRHSKLSP